jgi:iron complex transport system permease protein
MIAGADNRGLLPAAGLIGGIFLLAVDTATRIIGPAEMPISILTGMIGAPVYAWLLYRQRMTIR